ncbi:MULTISPECIES: MarR family winged helix-turn-helix transcriptional regulator [Pseudonocardia]|uniref:MarR family protein n=2 Tax=Pseudonocardia TaxID=1847 RepID=A0A1Y2N6Z2_PSEAH|nr:MULTISPECIES: MarR family transcriptional regulator [Pseudonocardia]OSY43234.1 MarR family protein [Pseudonocardia autotrophica]TDN71722.1 DNA-binding MarR family transcriptional regulator [Pseudonocardia autotrophica]BBG02409.1 MarR family transcriptional regulator [Pseudonocardia autotrophica]GEC23255.1 MarR family transcriptional regulator [Pseudonocardia saturnea]
MSGLDPDELVRLRVVLARITRGLDRHSRGSDLTRTQVSVLGTVVVRGPIGMGELAGLEGLNPTMLSRLAGKMEAAGLLVRDTDPADGRAVRVAATEAGIAEHTRQREERARLLAEHVDGLPDGHAEGLRAALPALEALAGSLRASR